jgi:hypothetical protein
MKEKYIMFEKTSRKIVAFVVIDGVEYKSYGEPVHIIIKGYNTYFPRGVKVAIKEKFMNVTKEHLTIDSKKGDTLNVSLKRIVNTPEEIKRKQEVIKKLYEVL